MPGGADRALGALLGYGRAVEVARTLRPGWWVLRAWILALVVTGKSRHAHGTGLVPRVHGSTQTRVIAAPAGPYACGPPAHDSGCIVPCTMCSPR